MEFSFDRSRNQAGAAPTPNTDSTEARPSAVRAGPDLNSQDPSTIANERLRKAIERNRAKQAGREVPQMQAQAAQPATPPNRPPPRPAMPEARFSQNNGAFQNQSQTQFQAPPPPPMPPREMRVAPPTRPVMPEVEVKVETVKAAPVAEVHVEEEEAAEETASILTRKSRATGPKISTEVVSRRSVAKPENTEFVPVKRTQRKVATQVNYSTNSSASSARKKTKEASPLFQNWISKACWIFCVIMIGRLIFADGGVTDFYSQKNTVSSKAAELERIQKDNSLLIKEIERMKMDTGYQKKLVRDHLGFIAKDEFLVLFPKEK